jgi:PAS domain S-box-containing protein
MHCHGNPDDAPKALLDLYGRERGFGYQPGDIAGITAVSIPVDVALAKIKDQAFAIFGISLFGLSLLYVGICFFFNRVVVHNLRDLLDTFRHGLRDEKELGVMTFVEVDFQEITPERRELLLCVGQQIGITIESLQNVEQLVSSKDLLQSVFDGISDMMVLLDRDLRLKMVNKAYLQHYGVALEEVLEQPCPSATVAPGCPLSPESLKEIFHSQKPRTEEVQTGQGEIFLVHYYPIICDREEVAGIVGYIKDITAEKRVEQRIQRAEKMAALGQLAGGIAHEINNPLGVIRLDT